MARDVVQRAFDWLGRNQGFTRRSGDLFKHSDQVVALLDLQRSDYGRSYYINVGFALNQLHGGAVDKFGLCDIRLRAEALIGDADELLRLLDLETALDEDAREIELRRVFEERLVPAVDTGLTIDGLRQLEAAGQLGRGFVRKQARAVLAGQRASE